MSQEETWVRVTACENIPVREGRMIVVRGRQIAVFNLGDHFLAVVDRCPHQGGPPSEGIVSGTTVVCPLHAWKIDLKSGTLANSAGSAACIATLRTRVSDGIVELQVASVAADHEPGGESLIHRDRPIRWVQRKPSSAISAPSEVL
jgi:nitrite reductase (NADH) small subunit